ncbi:MAG: NADH-quinone oxidoreductase subunit L, partial [Limisphaerales bacterium]
AHPGLEGHLLFAVGVFVAALTTFYTFRLFFVVFCGGEKSDIVSHAHESPPVMTLPLIVLAVFSLIGGWIGVEGVYNRIFPHQPEKSAGFASTFFAPFEHSPMAAWLGVGAFCIGLACAYVLYAKAETDPLPEKLGGLATAMRNKFYFDEIYQGIFVRAHDFIAAVADGFDRWIIEGACIGLIRGGTNLSGRALRHLQTGNLQTYAFLFVLGVAIALYVVLK